MTVTLREVAELAGVSKATASRVLSLQSGFSKATRQRVFAAANELSYDRSWTAQGRPSAQKAPICLVLGLTDGTWTPRVLNGAWRAAAEHGIDVVVLTASDLGDENWGTRVAEYRPRGVVFGLVQPSRNELAALHSLRIPIVRLGSRSEALPGTRRVETTDWEGGCLAGDHLAQVGIDELVIVRPIPSYHFGRARAKGARYGATLRCPDLPITMIDTGWEDRGPLPNLVTHLRDATHRVGVFAINDAIALRCYESAERAGRAVGDDVLVVGFDDEPIARAVTPSLTTLRQPLEAMAAHAVTALAKSPAHNILGDESMESLAAKLVIRASTGSGVPPVS